MIGKHAQGLSGFPTPDSPAGSGGYLLFYFPDAIWGQYLLGAVKPLTIPYNWYEAGDMSPDDAASEFACVIEEAPLNLLPSEDECVLPDGGRLLRLSSTGHTEEQKAGSWIEPDGDYTVPPVPARTGGTAEDQMCLASANAANVLQQLYEQLSDDWNAGLSEADAIADIVTTIAAIVGAPFGLAAESLIIIGRLIFQVVYETLDFIGADVWNSTFTAAFQQILRCCASNTAGVVTFDYQCVIDGLARQTNVFDLTLSQLRLFGQLNFILSWLGADGLNAAGATTAITSATCDDCVWCYTFDFTQADGGWFAGQCSASYTGISGVYSSGAGWQEQLGIDTVGARAYSVVIHKTVTTHITRLELTYDRVVGQYSPANEFYRFAKDGSITTPGTSFQTAASPGAGGTDLLLTWTGNQDITDLCIFMRSSFRNSLTISPSPSGSATLKKLTIWGTGDNPFGDDNCA